MDTLIVRLLLFRLAERQDTVHLVVNDHVALVHTHTGLGENQHRLRRHSAVYADLSAAVGLVAGAALIRAGGWRHSLHDQLRQHPRPS